MTIAGLSRMHGYSVGLLLAHCTVARRCAADLPGVSSLLSAAAKCPVHARERKEQASCLGNASGTWCAGRPA